jgi:hypothetical protein
MRDERQQQLTSNWLNIMAAGTVSGGIVSQLIAMGSGASVRDSIVLASLHRGRLRPAPRRTPPPPMNSRDR